MHAHLSHYKQQHPGKDLVAAVLGRAKLVCMPAARRQTTKFVESLNSSTFRTIGKLHEVGSVVQLCSRASVITRIDSDNTNLTSTTQHSQRRPAARWR